MTDLRQEYKQGTEVRNSSWLLESEEGQAWQRGKIHF